MRTQNKNKQTAPQTLLPKKIGARFFFQNFARNFSKPVAHFLNPATNTPFKNGSWKCGRECTNLRRALVAGINIEDAI